MKYSENELYAFVWRADTNKKVAIAEKWLKDHFNEIGADLFDDLMICLSQNNRAISAANEGRQYHI